MDEQTKEALDGLKQGVAELTQAVADVKAGTADPEKLDAIAAEVQSLQEGFTKLQNMGRSGFTPADEEVITARLGATRQERMMEIQTREPKAVAAIIHKPVEEVQAFQEAATRVAILGAICDARKGDADGSLPRRVQETAYFKDEYLPLAQAMDSTTAAEGDEFVPTLLSGNLIDRINLALRVGALFQQIEMPSQPFEIPGRAVARQRLGKAAENTADTGQTGFKIVTPGSRKVTLTAVKFAGEALVSKEAEEDAIVAMLPFIESELVDFMAADWEDALINGDATGGHRDSDTTASDDPRRAIEGLRALTNSGARTDLSNADPTIANSLRANRTKMGKYGVSLGDLTHILSLTSYMKLLGDTNVYTVDKYGANATILAGELGRADGVPLVVSEYVRSDLNASGVFDNTTTNRSIILTTNRRGFVIGNRRGLTVQVLRELYAEYDQDAVIASHRKAFQVLYPNTENVVGETYNVKAA